MPIPGPGTAISMTTIATEFGGTVPHSLSEYYRGGGLVPNTPGNAAIPTSGQIAMNNFYGSANRNTVALTISANTNNYDVYTNRGPTYVAGTSDITVTVDAPVTVGSTSTPTYALLVPSAFSPTDTVTIVNNGVIQGMGGAGGGGGNNGAPGAAGAVGGNAIYVNRPTIITNNGVVASGGGGGGGGGGASEFVSPKSPPRLYGGGGGGGGSGTNGGAGGAGGIGTPPVPVGYGGAGSPGTSPAGGAGGTGKPAPLQLSGPGGAGGGRGAGGVAGTSGNSGTGGGGAATGNYIVGNPFVTWPVTGTRQGNVA